ncbi:MAG: nitronate monooxygenase [Clostridia bacterium]|jgi:NAD(P)H-dependent flavin oxidoreductase YrpB (nitropropane dioxygenase family)|nr:nitronate monooxygenase [Clostridia bacterium]MCI2000031.1 nitronate monooxygenase [Clostridia bacterium]MCI2014435.1 nitronate monooxygenase [Clostridia bacterium]
MKLKPVNIGDIKLEVPIIQGGMGIGVSLSNLAGAVAKEGGMGVISAAQPGYNLPEWDTDPLGANLKALGQHIKRAKEISNNGVIGVNIMRASCNYDKYVKCCVDNGADCIISGAGLPIELPMLLMDTDVKFAPIVSSQKAVKVLFSLWERRYKKISDFIVIEGPKAGGHLGFKHDEAINLTQEDYDKEVIKILEYVHIFEEKYQRSIPVFFAGGVYTREDIDHYMSLGCAGVQMATRFVPTEECDAPMSFKQAYINAKKEDIVIVKSPVGMPGRAIRNPYVKEREKENEKITYCFRCLEKCDPATTPYCITMALIRAVRSETEADNSLIFCGENAYRLDKMTTVHEIFKELNS